MAHKVNSHSLFVKSPPGANIRSHHVKCEQYRPGISQGRGLYQYCLTMGTTYPIIINMTLLGSDKVSLYYNEQSQYVSYHHTYGLAWF